MDVCIYDPNTRSEKTYSIVPQHISNDSVSKLTAFHYMRYRRTELKPTDVSIKY